MHIGLVCPEYPVHESANGVSTYTARMVDALRCRGHEITVFCLRPQAEDGSDPAGDVNGVRVCWVKPAGRCDRGVACRAWSFMKHRLMPHAATYSSLALALRDTVRAAHTTRPLDLLQCPEWAGLPWWLRDEPIPLVVRLHCPAAVSYKADGVPPSRQLRTIADLERRCIGSVSALTAASQACVTQAEATLGLSIPSTRIIPNAVLVDDWTPQSGMQRDEGALLFVGRMDLIKGFDGVVQAFAQLAARDAFRDVRLDVVGYDRGLRLEGGAPIPGDVYASQVVEDPQIRGRITLHGRQRPDAVRQQRWPGRIVVVPSRFENFPNTAVEAMAAGCAVVASDAGGIPEIIQHGRNGLLFQSENWEDLACQIQRLLTDEALRRALAEQGRIDVQERYDPDRIACETESFYNEVAAQYADVC